MPNDQHPFLTGAAVTSASWEPLTKEALLEAMDKLEAERRDGIEELNRAVERFDAAVPEIMRDAPIVHRMRTILATGYILHPKQHQALKDEYKAELKRRADHA